ncbi:MAG TPA: hypothetical protein VFO69_12400 [Allosphingosinicella sp.]|nr:hypothetical protein [Allosphingosinicella sp.]
MIGIISLLMAAALTAGDSPPAAAASFLEAVASGDLAAARALVSNDAMIVDESQGSPSSSLEAFAEYVRGCERQDLTWDVDQDDPGRAASVVTWVCPSRAAVQAFIWTEQSKVVAIQFGPAPEQ